MPLVAFKWKEALARKGAAGARIHYGATAQAVRDAFLARGLDPRRYALFCEDALIGPDGEPTDETRLGLRYDQFDRLRMEAIRRKLTGLSPS